MFEKESEEYTNFVKFTKERWHCNEIFYTDIELAYQKGAELGYNKAKKEIEEELLKCYQGYPEEEVK